MQKEEFVLFWGGVFSNWHLCNFQIDGILYNCTEQHMMASKASFFGDSDTLSKILASDNPREQKKLGRQVKGYDDERWDAVAREIVYKGNYAKYTQNFDLLEQLLATKGKILVEASPYDRKWGIGLKESHPDALDRSKWRGLNWLGEVLTKLRDNLIVEKDAEN